MLKCFRLFTETPLQPNRIRYICAHLMNQTRENHMVISRYYKVNVLSLPNSYAQVDLELYYVGWSIIMQKSDTTYELSGTFTLEHDTYRYMNIA